MQELYMRFHGFLNKTKSSQIVFSMTFTGVKAYLGPNQDLDGTLSQKLFSRYKFQ